MKTTVDEKRVLIRQFVNAMHLKGAAAPISVRYTLYTVKRDNLGRPVSYILPEVEGAGRRPVRVGGYLSKIMDYNLSTSKDTRGCLIVHGYSNDFGNKLQSRLKQYAIYCGTSNNGTDYSRFISASCAGQVDLRMQFNARI